ncbi:hypothetical protein ACI797_08740 [Geodermatophilus sp. SYSU D00691]
MSLRRLAVPALILPALVATAVPAVAGAGLAPGGDLTITVRLPTAWATQADRLGVSVVDLVQAENDCLEPETAAGDTTCGADEGDLAGQLTAFVTAGQLVDGVCRTSGAREELILTDPDEQAILSVDGAGCLAIDLAFPSDDDDNLAQSDSIRFAVRTLAELPGVTPPRSTPSTTAEDDTATTVTGAGGTGGGGQGATGAQGAAGGPDAAGGPAAAGTATDDTAAAADGTAPVGEGSAPLLGEQTTPVAVDGDSVDVRTQAAETSLGALVLTYGSLFLGVVLLGLVLFLWWSRRRRRPVVEGAGA